VEQAVRVERKQVLRVPLHVFLESAIEKLHLAQREGFGGFRNRGGVGGELDGDGDEAWK